MIRKKIHAKTIAVVLAVATTLQVTGIASRLVNGVEFVTANADSNVPSQENTQTIITNVTVSGAGIDGTAEGYVVAKVPTEINSSLVTSEEEYESTGAVKWIPITLTLYVQNDYGQTVKATEDTNLMYIDVYGDGTSVFGGIDIYKIGNPMLYSGGGEDLIATFQTTNGISYSVSNFEYFGIPNYLYVPFNVVIEANIPASIEITKDDDTLTAILKNENEADFTTSAEVTYYWYREGELIQSGTDNTYSITDDDKGKSFTVKVEEYNLESDPLYIDEDEQIVTTPASVRIKGARMVGETLEAQLLTGGGETYTTPAGVTYEWRRLSSIDSDDEGDLIGEDKTYILISSDQDRYIKLIASYDGKSFERITGKISSIPTSSSSSSSSSHKHSNSSESSNSSSSQTTNNQQTTTNNKPTIGWSGWLKNNNSSWMYIENGQPVIGWKQVNGNWYLMDSTGTMTIGWQQDNGKWYLLNNEGAMVTGWQKVNGKWYYLYRDGSMASNTVIDGYVVDSNGAWVG
jgi:hypothetical protein